LHALLRKKKINHEKSLRHGAKIRQFLFSIIPITGESTAISEKKWKGINHPALMLYHIEMKAKATFSPLFFFEKNEDYNH